MTGSWQSPAVIQNALSTKHQYSVTTNGKSSNETTVMTAGGGSSLISNSLRQNHRRRYSNHKMSKSTLANYVNARPFNNCNNGNISATAKSRPHSRASAADCNTSAVNSINNRQRSLSQTSKQGELVRARKEAIYEAKQARLREQIEQKRQRRQAS